MKLREAVLPQPWRGLVSSVFVALRLGPINCSHNMSWANVHSIVLCYVTYFSGLMLVFFVLVFKKGLGAPYGVHAGDEGPR